MMSAIFILGVGLFLLPLLFRLALRLRLGVPMLYIVLALTVFHDWTRANPELADGILFVLVGLVALSWVITVVRKLCDFIDLTERTAQRRSCLLIGSDRPRLMASTPSVPTTSGAESSQPHQFPDQPVAHFDAAYQHQ